MKNYHLYDVMDFVSDEDFIRWVNEKDPADETFWNNWLEQYPEKHLAVAEARQILQTIRVFDDNGAILNGRYCLQQCRLLFFRLFFSHFLSNF